MVNPLDLFSEDTPNRQSSQLIRPSSPIQETETLKELKLIELQKELLQKRNSLKEDVQRLEKEWNQMRSHADIQENNEEDDAIFELLIQKANEEKQQNDKQIRTENSIVEEKDKDDLDRFSAKPSKDWNLRIEYLQKFYPDVRITNHTSNVSLEYNDPTSPKKSQFIKTISFILGYPKNLIRLNLQVKLIKVENSYQIHDLIISKESNNKLNTLLLTLINHYSASRNINELLYTINKLYKNLLDRLQVLTELRGKYDIQQSSVFQNQFTYKNITLLWDFIFQNGKIKGIVNVNDDYNDAFKDLVDEYGVQRAVEMLIRTLYPDDDKSMD